MKIKVKASPGMTQRDIRRLVESLDGDMASCELQTFSITHPHNCAVLKTAELLPGENLVAQFVLVAATCTLFEVSSDTDHRGWLFMLPASGNTFATPSGVVYTRPELGRLKEAYLKRVRVVEGDMRALDPEIYLPHSDFSIYGIDSGALLFISRNSTHVVTQ